MQNKRIILASASPRRRELLKLLGFDYEICKSDFDEETLFHLPAEELALKAAEFKAASVAGQFNDAVIIAADTIVALNSKVFPKPQSEKQAKEFLQELRGKTHQVITGVAMIYFPESSMPVSDIVKTDVKMKKYSDEEIDDYIKTGEPLDKAGAYGIQGHGHELVESVEGCYFNVVGLPIERMLEMLGRYFDTSQYYKNIPKNFRLF